MSKMNMLEIAKRKEIIRAGATYPSAVPSSYFEPSEHPTPPGSHKKQIVLTFDRNTRPRPAFGATRDEGAAGPIKSLSPYADAVDCNRRFSKPAYLKLRNHRAAAPRKQRDSELAIPRGPTAETIISMTAAGQKPPVPEEGQIERQKAHLSKISVALETAVSRQINDGNKQLEAVLSDVKTTKILSEKIPGYHQTWGVAFSQETFTPSVYRPGPGGAKYPQDYPPGVIQPQ